MVNHNYFKAARAVAFLLFLPSCKEGYEEKNAPQHYPTTVLAPVCRTWEVEYPALLKGRQSVEIRPQCDGLITQICIEEGAYVKKGQTLFVIDQAPYLAAQRTASAYVSQAEARLASARLTLQGKEALFNEHVVALYELQTARNELKAAEAALEQAHAQLNNAATALSYTVVKSPVNGVAGMIPYRVGALVDRNISEPLVCVSDTEEMFAYFSVAEHDETVRRSRQGDTIKIKFKPHNAAYPAAVGRIDAVSGTVDSRTGTICIRARIPNPDRLLYDGSHGTVIVPSEKANCLVIPQTAAYEIQNRTFVYRVIDGKAVSTAVEVEDIGNGREFIVTDGLNAGDEIVSEGAGLIREGTEISHNTTVKNTL